MPKIRRKDVDSSAKTPKSARTRAAILQAARELFAECGYERTTVRDIAARASIDPAMVMRYFGSKDALFAQATVFDLELPDFKSADPSEFGAILIGHFLDLWEGPASKDTLTILLRTAATDEAATAKVRDIFSGQVMPMLARAAGPAEGALRAGLISSHLLGLALCRYVLKLSPVVMMTPEQIVGCVGPTLQRYIAGKL